MMHRIIMIQQLMLLRSYAYQNHQLNNLVSLFCRNFFCCSPFTLRTNLFRVKKHRKETHTYACQNLPQIKLYIVMCTSFLCQRYRIQLQKLLDLQYSNIELSPLISVHIKPTPLVLYFVNITLHISWPFVSLCRSGVCLFFFPFWFFLGVLFR